MFLVIICSNKLFCKKYACNEKRKTLIYTHNDAGWSSLVARRAHNPKVGGSNPPSATT